MPEFEITVHGYNRVNNALRRLAANMPGIGQRVIYKWAQKTRGILKSRPYPPKRPRQKYVRTGRLANSWAAARTPTGATITNKATYRGNTYPSYVVGNAKGDGQAWMHKGRWWKARDVIDEQTDALVKELGAELLKEWRK